ncbi:Transcriptional activator [Tulasnella sp. 403]|nr:Transcriptional activator [Tulasnella sp. 403]
MNDDYLFHYYSGYGQQQVPPHDQQQQPHYVAPDYDSSVYAHHRHHPQSASPEIARAQPINVRPTQPHYPDSPYVEGYDNPQLVPSHHSVHHHHRHPDYPEAPSAGEAAQAPISGLPSTMPGAEDVMDEEPLYVNAKQYHRILKRRIARQRLEEVHRLSRQRKPYLHESRHKHAMRRPRGPGGRFLTAAEIAAGLGGTPASVTTGSQQNPAPASASSAGENSPVSPPSPEMSTSPEKGKRRASTSSPPEIILSSMPQDSGTKTESGTPDSKENEIGGNQLNVVDQDGEDPLDGGDPAAGVDAEVLGGGLGGGGYVEELGFDSAEGFHFESVGVDGFPEQVEGSPSFVDVGYDGNSTTP